MRTKTITGLAIHAFKASCLASGGLPGTFVSHSTYLPYHSESIGYTWALSHAAVPCIVNATATPNLNTTAGASSKSQPSETQAEATLLAAWRTQYLCGFYISRPLCAINLVCFLYLAFSSSPPAISNSAYLSPKSLYILAALLSASGVPYALTFLRRTNGALSIRAKRLAGLGEDPTAIALTYAASERRSLEREGAREFAGGLQGSRRLVERWSWHNWVRTFVLLAGLAIGAVGLVVDGMGR